MERGEEIFSLEQRPYQEKAWQDMAHFTRQRLRDLLENPKDIDWYTTLPLHMATGSGKTVTVGKHLDKVFHVRNRIERLYYRNLPLNVLFLNDRIRLVNQLKEDMVDGRDGKPALISSDIVEHATIKVFHSKSDDTGVPAAMEDVEVDVYSEGKDTLYFSTFGSAGAFADEGTCFDIIVVDEAHHLQAPTYRVVLDHHIALTEKLKGRPPLIIPMSATLDPVLHMLNEPVVDFGLPAYLASPYSPEVVYHLVTSGDFGEEDLAYVSTWIEQVTHIDDYHEKKQAIEEIRIYVEGHLAKFPGLTELCTDLLERLPVLEHTILFVSSIDEADEIVAQINNLTGDKNTAVALHSRIDEADEEVIGAYQRGTHNILVAVDKLNEGVDMPWTQQVVFWRNTKSLRLFKQQFGRGLRGEKVALYDYTGVLSSMAWIADINEQIERIYNHTGDASLGGTRERKGIEILLGEVAGSALSHTVSLETVISKIEQLKKDNDLPLLGEDGQVEIEGKVYQQVGDITPSEQLLGIRGYIVARRVKKQGEEWKEEYTRKAKASNGTVVIVVEKEELKKLLKEEINIPKLGEDQQVEIEGKIYQRVSSPTFLEKIYGIKGKTAIIRVKKQGEEWKRKYIRKAKSGNGNLVIVVEREALKKLLEKYIGLSVIGEDGQVEIEGKIYQQVGKLTSSEQLWGVSGNFATKRVKKQGEEWKRKYIRKAKSGNGHVVVVVERKALKELLQDYIGIAELGEDRQVEIEGKVYQQVGDTTPSEQLWGIKGQTVATKVRKQGEARKEKYVRQAKASNGSVVIVVEREALKELLKEDIHTPKLGEGGQVEIEGKMYQRVGANTASEKLFGVSGEFATRRVRKQGEARKEKYVRQAKASNGSVVIVVEREALKELLQDEIGVPAFNSP